MRQKIINFFLRNVVRVVVEDDIMRFDKANKKIYIGKQELTDSEKNSLRAEAKALANMRIWGIINETVKDLCYQRGWRLSENIEELNMAKAQFGVLELQQDIVEKLSNVV